MEFFGIFAVLLAISTTQLVSVILVIIFLFLGFKLLETTWSYKISKPFAWEQAVKEGTVSRKLRKIERLYRDKVRFYHFWLQIERLKKENVSGAFAELGVYQGETAKMIHAMDPSRKFYLLDTFNGFSENDIQKDPTDQQVIKSVNFSDTSIDAVTRLVDGNENVKIIAGIFPETSNQLPEESYALVHLDADLYQPTLAGLQYFYPRLSPGGVIFIHDYNHNWEGVRKAVDEFVKAIPESLTELSDWQGSVMIVKNKNA